MDDTQPTPEPQAETTPETGTPIEDVQVESAAETPQAPAPAYDWRKALDDAPADEIRRHPKFAGIVGSEQQTWRQTWESQQKAQVEADAKAAAEREVEELAERNPVAFADRWLGEKAAAKAREQITNLETNARQAIGRQIGAAFHAIPEWADIAGDADSLAKLATSLQGKSQDEVLTAWNTTAVELVANRRATALAERLIADRLKTERAAWETEAAANGFVTSSRPDLVRGGRASTSDPEPDMWSREWDAWYRRTTRGAAR